VTSLRTPDRDVKLNNPVLAHHWKIRVVLPGAILHLASSTNPVWLGDELEYTPIESPLYGDTVGHLDWTATLAVTWREYA
jgi:hypothetical protein